jgi:hypothetical protein
LQHRIEARQIAERQERGLSPRSVEPATVFGGARTGRINDRGCDQPTEVPNEASARSI